MATLYLAIYPAAAPAPTWDRVSGWSGSPVYTDADTSPETSGTYTFVPDSSGLSAGTPYVWYAVWDDGSTTVGPVESEAFETLGGGVSFRALIITDGTLRVLPVGQENTGKKPIVLLDGNLKERVGSEGVPIILDAGAIRTLGQGESLVS